MFHPCYALTQKIHAIHSGQGQIVWNHILREANQAADELTKQTLLDDDSFQINFPRGF